MPLFDPEMHNFFQKAGRRRAVEDNFYVEEVFREQRKFMRMAARQISVNRSLTSLDLFDQQLRRVRGRGNIILSPPLPGPSERLRLDP
jgi:hypothetical protein